MSILSTIVADVKKFAGEVETSAEKFASAFVKIFKKLPSAEQAIQNFIGQTAPYITAAVALADPIAEPEIAGALALVETGLAAIQASTTAAQSGTSLVTNLQSFATTVPQLLTGLAIKNANLQSTITRIVNLVTGEAKILIPLAESWVAQLAGKPPIAPAA